jgi:hypothetical protein
MTTNLTRVGLAFRNLLKFLSWDGYDGSEVPEKFREIQRRLVKRQGRSETFSRFVAP